MIAPDFTFANTYTKGPLDNAAAASLGQEFAALLLGVPGGSMTRNPTASYATQNKYFGTYLQDDIKLTPRLTINLGLRYEYEWPLTERFNRLINAFDATATGPIAPQATANYAAIYAKTPIVELPPSAFAVKGGLTFAGAGGGRSPFHSNHGEWMPRIGLAFRLNEKSVLRTGYGIYFGTLGVDTFIPQQAGFSQSTPIQASLDNGVTYQATLANPLPTGLLPALGAAGGLATNLGQNVSAFDPNISPPYSQRWSFGVQRFLPGRFVLDVSYVGNRSTHLSIAQQANATPAKYLSTLPVRDQATVNALTQTFTSPFAGLNPVFGTSISRATLLEPFPEFGTVTIQRSLGYSWYHALQAKAEKRLSKGYTLQFGYTWSKFMQATEFQNASDARPYKVISDSDRTHVVTLSGVWELPLRRGRSFGGWQLNGTVIRQSGAALGFGNALFTGNLQDIPLPSGERTPDRWFNTDAGFNRVSTQQLANNVQTFPIRFSGIRADGQSTWNFSLFKNFKLAEKAAAQFRAEVYNTMNHPSFDVPNTTTTNSSFGASTAVVSEPRNWQFALKLTF